MRSYWPAQASNLIERAIAANRSQLFQAADLKDKHDPRRLAVRNRLEKRRLLHLADLWLLAATLGLQAD